MLTLREDVSHEIRQFLKRDLKGVKVVSDAPESAVIVRDNALPVELEVAGRDDWEERLGSSRPRSLLLLLNAVLDDGGAARLEDAGIGYIDPTGRWWIPGGGRTPRSQALEPSVGPSIRAASLRLGQLLADHPDERWTERHLASRGNTTQATAHRLLIRLERDGYVERQGKGRGASRSVSDVLGLRRWLAREGRPGRGRTLSCFVSNPDALPARADGYALVLTGAGAAERIGIPVRTDASRPMVRVGVGGDELEAVPTALGGFRTDRGANLTLVADPQRLALTDPRALPDGAVVAPPSRIMLDLYLEPRGEAAVEVFLDLWGSGSLPT